MKIRDRFINAYHSIRGGHAVEVIQRTEAEPANLKTPKKHSASDFPEQRPIYREKTDIRDLEEAITVAETLNKYNRSELHRIYRQYVLEDPHVVSNWTNRKMKTLKRDFSFSLIGSPDPDEEFTELFNKPWFYDFIEKVLESRAWGFSALELFNWNSDTMQFERYRNEKTKEIYSPVQLINPDYVRPETGYVVKHIEEATKGLDIFSDLSDTVIFCGSSDHGFLYKLAKPILFKENAIANWSEWIEVFGIDAILIKTDAQGEDRRSLISAMQNFGSSRVGTILPEDEVNVIGSSRADAFNVFHKMAEYVDSSTSKIIFGQDVISNNTGQVVGNVGENVANDYAIADGRYIEAIVNYELLPLMERNGYIKDATRMQFGYNYNLSTRELAELAEVDLKISQMGMKHNPDSINERYGVDVESAGVMGIDAMNKKLKEIYPVK